MSDIENVIKDENRLLYWASEIPKLVGASTPSLSTFYRYAREGKIRKVNADGPEDAYDGPDVRRFLKGEMSPRGNKFRSRKASFPKEIDNYIHEDVAVSVPRPFISYVRDREDLAYLFLFLMESQERGEDTLLPSTALSWVKGNEWSYWFLSNPDVRDDIWAVLGFLPLDERIILRLLHGEIALRDVALEDILSSAKSSYTYYLSALVKPEHQDALIQLFQSFLSFMCKEKSDIRIDKLSVSVSYGMEPTPLRLMVKNFYFSPLHEISDTAWELDFGFSSPSTDVQEFQECCSNVIKEGKLMVIASPIEETVISPEVDEKIVLDRRRKVRSRMSNVGGYGRYKSILDGGVSVTRITSQKWFRTAHSDDDIRAILDINASHFGKSTRAEDDLIRTRRSWIEKNPEVFHVLEVSRDYLLSSGVYSLEELEGIDKKIVGFISMLPLSDDIIDKLIKSELAISEVTGGDVLTYVPGRAFSLFVQTIAIHQVINSRNEEVFTTLGNDLYKGLMGMFTAYGQQGIEIQFIHARSDTWHGKGASMGFGFKKVPTPLGVEKDVFLLDIVSSQFPFLVDYVADLQKYKEEHSLLNLS